MNIKYQLKIKSLNKGSFFLYKEFLKLILNKTNINFKIFNLPLKKKRITLLKSPHVNKSAREQFEIKYFKTILQITNEIDSNILKLLLTNKPKTVSVSFKAL